ncbi:hypothetical protein HanRHA438_Chr04g0200711 [Helianthus annuus]|nr:hypothetical protein HanRHA438_Chr04g0200711 [Helianthus annuus]
MHIIIHVLVVASRPFQLYHSYLHTQSCEYFYMLKFAVFSINTIYAIISIHTHTHIYNNAFYVYTYNRIHTHTHTIYAFTYTHTFNAYTYTHIVTLLIRFMFILILTCIFIRKLIVMLIILMIHIFVPVREWNPRDLLTWVLYIHKHGLAYILYSYTHIFLFLNYVYPDSYSTSTSYADHATIKIIAGAHGIIVISA